MKRFTTYLYLYEQGEKTINVGFILVDVRDGKGNMRISVRNLSRVQELGKIYALINENGLLGVELGEMRIFNGQGNATIVVDALNLMDSGYSLEDVVGISIHFQNKGYVASCWHDAFAEEIGEGSIRIRPWIPPQLEEITTVEPEMIFQQEKIMEKEIIYKKIDLNQIQNLPSRNWYLCNNSFLIHGFWNYGYLLLKTVDSQGETKTSLGVPGIYEKPEKLMAVLFGFPEFEAVPEEIKEVEIGLEKRYPEKERNQEPEVGTFGCWFVELNK